MVELLPLLVIAMIFFAILMGISTIIEVDYFKGEEYSKKCVKR